MEQQMMFIQAPRRSSSGACCGVTVALFVVFCFVGAMVCLTQVDFAQFQASMGIQVYEFDEATIQEEFLAYTKKFKKFYYTSEEKQARFGLFSNAYKLINQHNMDLTRTFDMEINQFADMTEEEYHSYFALNRRRAIESSFRTVKRVNKTLNAGEIDWDELGHVAPVKNQGGCGSCWAFSAIGAVETLHSLNAGKMVRFSEQELVDCSWDYGNMGCAGGWMDDAFRYIVDHGIASEEDYPYKGYDSTCIQGIDRAFTIGGFTDIPNQDNDAMLDALQKQTISVAVDAGNTAFRYYKSGNLLFNQSFSYLNRCCQ
jgi:KDEL-tailed cysteine endopeptidase